MSRPDATASAALDGKVIRPVWFVYMDFKGDAVRANSSGMNITVAGTGDPDLDGFEYKGLPADLVGIGPVKTGLGGSSPVTAKLSGLTGLDDEQLAIIGDPLNWQGREVRLWRIIRNAANEQQGGFQHYYTGYMMSVDVGGDATEDTITVTMETYIASLSQASNRSYLDQSRYDPGDLSARASIAIANGLSLNPATGNSGGNDGIRRGREVGTNLNFL